MVVARDLSKLADRPISLLPTKQQRIDTKKKKDIIDTAGPAWFNMPAAERTPELEKDLRILSMRSALDPKRHYRRNASIGKSKYLQVGTVVADPSAFYTDRLPKKNRGKSILDTLMRDTERQQYFKRKYTELQEANIKAGRGSQVTKNGRKPWKTRSTRKSTK